MEYKLSAKKIKLIRKTYETYCQVNTLQATRQATGLGINTIRKYIVLAEEINNKNKLSSKDRYYTPETPEVITPDEIIFREPPEPPIYNIYNKELIIENKNSNINNNLNNIDKEIITDINNNKEYNNKDKIILNKLNNISNKYLDYLNNIDLYNLDKVNIKDIGIIAGISLDKASQLKHKDTAVKNQSIIFNLFGNNKSLSEFIAGSIGRQERLSSRPVKKYTPALNK